MPSGVAPVSLFDRSITPLPPYSRSPWPLVPFNLRGPLHAPHQ